MSQYFTSSAKAGINDSSITRSHRTVLFVDAQKRASGGEYLERTNRLIESVNGSNIKVDIVEVDGATLKPLGAATPASGQVDADALTEWAKAKGYTQILFSVPGAKS